MPAIFKTDTEALIFISIIITCVFIINKLISMVLYRSKKVAIEQKNKINFLTNLFSVIFVAYFFVEGFPSFEKIDPIYTAIITGSVSTALAFALSEIFSNLMAGLLLIIVDPFDNGDVVKIKGHKGIIRSMTLTRVILETFDNVIVEISNSEVVSSKILNYTIKLKSTKNYFHFRKEVEAPQDKGYRWM